MADPITVVSLVASIVQLIDVTIKIIEFAKDVKDATKDQAKLALEASNLLSLLMTLRYDLEQMNTEDEEWLTALRLIGTHDGPLMQLRHALEELAGKLEPQTGMKQLGRKLLWPIDKKQLATIIGRIERIKTLIALAYERDTLALSLAIKADLNDVSRRVMVINQAVENLQTHISKQERDEILSWLSPLVYGSKQSDVIQRYQEGTGKWLLETDQYLEWRTASGKILWCPGMPGAGKTTLASYIISEFERNLAALPEIGLAYAYCNYKNQNETAINLLGSLLRQLLHNRDALPTCLISLYKSHCDKGIGTRPNLTEIAQCLAEVFGSFSDVFVIVDALDEYDEGDGVRDVLGRELLKLSSLPNAHVLVTSRWLTNIEVLFEGCLRLEIKATDQDISKYLEKRMENSSRLQRRIKGNSQLKEEIVTTIVERCDGMFLLAQLHMDSLQTKANVKAIRDALQTIPRKLDDTYDLVMERIEGQNEDDVNLARQTLSWLTYCVRPLTVVELQHALAVHLNASDFDDESLVDEETMLSICAGIVTVEEKSNIIRFIHYTTQEYFERIRQARFPNAEHEITEICIAYLHREEFANGFCRQLDNFKQRIGLHPLLKYAAKHWGDHARGEVETTVEESILSYLMDDSTLPAATQILYYDDHPYRKRNGMPIQRGVHVAAYFALEHILSRLIENGLDPDSVDSFGQTALHVTVSRYFRSPCIKVLLDNDRDYSQSISHSVLETHLMSHNSSKSYLPKAFRAWTLLHLSAISGRPHLAQEAVERLAGLHTDDPIAKENRGWTALHRSAFNGHEKVAQVLLNAGFDVNSEDIEGATAMHVAAIRGKESVIRLLAKFNANINQKNKRGEAPLHHAALPVAELLLELGAAVNCVDSSGRTPLYWASLADEAEIDLNKKREFTEFLLSKGAKLNLEAHSLALLKFSNVAKSLPEKAIYEENGIGILTVKRNSHSDSDCWHQERKTRVPPLGNCLDGWWILEQGIEVDDEDNCDFSHSMMVNFIQRLREIAVQLNDVWFIRDIREMRYFLFGELIEGSSGPKSLYEAAQRITTLLEKIEDGAIETNIDTLVQQIDKTMREIHVIVEKARAVVESFYDFRIIIT